MSTPEIETHILPPAKSNSPYRTLPPRNRFIQRGVLLYSLLLLFLHSLHFFILYPRIEDPTYAFLSWIWLAVAAVFTMLWVLLRAEQVSFWSLGISYVLIILVMAYDIRGSWFNENLLEQLSSAYAVTAIIIMIIVTVNYHWAVITIALYGLSILVLVQIHQPEALINQAEYSTVYLFSLATIIVVFLLVEKYRQTLESRIARIHASGDFSAPRIALGKEFHHQIVELDAAAEELLTRVSTGEESLPLSPRSAKHAGEIAQRLRATLLYEHHQTWLDHAVNNSVNLADWVAIDDPQHLIGLFTTAQRQALFSIIWQLTGTHHASPSVLTLTTLPVLQTDHDSNSQAIDNTPADDERSFVLTLHTKLHTRVMSPAIWLELDKLGSYQTQRAQKITQIIIRCSVPSGESL